MYRFNTVYGGLLLSLLGLSPSVLAADYTVRLQFEKRPPKTALLYVPGDLGEQSQAVVDQVDKSFTESLVVAAPGQAVVFKNSDEVDHNIFANDMKSGARFDVGLMPPGGEKNIPVDWKADSLVRIGCKIHPKMRTYIAAVDAAYSKVMEFSSATSDYSISLEGVPDAAAQLLLRIPKYDPVVIDLNDPSTWTATLTKKGKTRGSFVLER
ncbi:plastocyanin [Litorivivens lipolytica]|uniref:Plastocyanin n=1 Tax=Litorivivens lipolytica TaxID=1524264 RepID=A0A7W4W7Z8_9GAMM|nr:hypothetical protein [Litorivivens lipolytica]MBB3048688.1 plastocyanin [Litorivivens lipolytica]